MNIETAILSIYAARGYVKAADDINVILEANAILDGAPEYGYAFTGETVADFIESGWTTVNVIEGVTKMTKGEADIFIAAPLNDDRLGFYRGKSLTFLDA